MPRNLEELEDVEMPHLATTTLPANPGPLPRKTSDLACISPHVGFVVCTTVLLFAAFTLYVTAICVHVAWGESLQCVGTRRYSYILYILN